MDVVNFPGIIAQHGLLNASEINLANDLLLIGKKVGKQRDGSQYEELAINIQEFATLVAIAGGNETLAQTLVLGNTTGGTNIFITDGDNITYGDGIFEGRLDTLALTGNRAWNLPDKSGTIALLSDIPVASNIYNSDGITGSGRVVTITDTLEFTGGKVVLSDGTEGTPGYIWTSIDASGTGSWIPSPLASTNLYNLDDTITDPIRTVTIDTTLQFYHGAAAANGYFQLDSGGYVFNQTAGSSYFEYNHNNAIFTYYTDSASVTGVRSTNGGGVNPESQVELFAGSNSTAYLNIGPTTDRFDFYVNNTGKYAGGILGGSAAFNGSWGFGTQPTTSAKVYILSENGQGFGTVIQSMNLSPAESILEVRDAAGTGRLVVSATGVTTINYRAWIGTNLGSIPLNSTFAAKGSDALFASANSVWYDSGNTVLFQIQNNGNIGHNTAPVVGDRYKITAGAGYDGAINISANGLANGGYAILAQGGSGSANYNGIWSEANGGGTGIIKAFYGVSGTAGAATNIGGHFTARNGSTDSIAVWGDANGGDSIGSSFANVGVQGTVRAVAATALNRRAGYFWTDGNVDNGTTYGVKSEVTASGANAINFGIHSNVNGNGASVINTAGYFNANGLGGSTNNAILVPSGGGYIILGAANNINGSLLEISGDAEIIGTTDGLILEDRTLNTRHRVYLNNGILLIEAA